MFVKFTMDSGSHVMKFDGACPQFPPFPGVVFLMKVWSAHRGEVIASRVELLETAKHLAESIEQDRKLFPYRYSFEERHMGRDDLVVKGSGRSSGFLIDGKPHAITGGVGECYLEELIQGPDGKWKTGPRIDVRDKKRIATDDWGDIKISRKKVPFTLPEELSRLIQFLEQSTDRRVTISAYDSPTFKQLIVEAAEGMGADDAVMEMLLQRGPRSKKQLIAALKQKQFNDYRHIVVRFLLTMYPDHETQQIVQEFIEKMPDGEEKREYLAVLAAFAAVNDNSRNDYE